LLFLKDIKMSEGTIGDKTRAIMAAWANDLPPERRGGRQGNGEMLWGPDKVWNGIEFTDLMPLTTFDPEGRIDPELQTRLQTGLGLPQTHEWGKYTFGDIIHQIEKIPANQLGVGIAMKEIGATVSARMTSEALHVPVSDSPTKEHDILIDTDALVRKFFIGFANGRAKAERPRQVSGRRTRFVPPWNDKNIEDVTLRGLGASDTHIFSLPHELAIALREGGLEVDTDKIEPIVAGNPTVRSVMSGVRSLTEAAGNDVQATQGGTVSSPRDRENRWQQPDGDRSAGVRYRQTRFAPVP
jgi:hypothetical protein